MRPGFYGIPPPYVRNRADAAVLLGTLRAMATSPDSQKQKHPSCARCGKHMPLLNSFLDPRSGNQVRTFKCECGAPVVVVIPE
jgi:hypothetical protein